MAIGSFSADFYSAKIPIIQKQLKASVNAGLLKIYLQNSGKGLFRGFVNANKAK
jgi:hypothetical protein